MILEEDTIYYRRDHPNGFMFSAGNEAPSLDDGWAEAADQIVEGDAPSYECTTLAAYDELVRTERQGVQRLITDLQQATLRLSVAAGLVAELTNENARLSEENAALRTAAEGA
jgi:hypothetical protein